MSNQNQNETELLPPSQMESSGTLGAITRAEVDIQIATAKRYPRVLSKVKQDMLSFATLDEETAQACFYTLKRKDKEGKQKLIQGASIRLAEIAASCFGNIRSGARVVSNDGKTIVCQGVCHDLERNVFFSMETTRRITTREGRTYSDDMQVTTANAACAIALRNAITKTVPLALIKPVLDEAKRVAVGDVKSLAAKREKVITRLKAMGADEENILAAVDARKIDDIDLVKLELLIGLGTAIKDGETSLEEAFPAPEQQTKSSKPDTAPAPKVETPEQQPATPTEIVSAQDQLMELVKAEGFSFAELVEWAVQSGNLETPVNTLAEIPEKSAQSWMKAKRGLLASLAQLRKAAQ